MKKVIVFGTFDIVHMGHIHMFKQAREYGDYLVAVIARDVNVEKIKGIGSLHTEKERAAFLTYIQLIDEVCLGGFVDPYKVLKEQRPDVVALGYDQKIFVDRLEEALTNFGIEAQIVRLSPYSEERFKSSKIKKFIERIV